jgi:hypothetical protein
MDQLKCTDHSIEMNTANRSAEGLHSESESSVDPLSNRDSVGSIAEDLAKWGAASDRPPRVAEGMAFEEAKKCRHELVQVVAQTVMEFMQRLYQYEEDSLLQ